MIRYTRGNLLEATTVALVNTVNEVGVMGKGIALMFRDSFRENTRVYEAACETGKVRVGEMLVVRERDLTGDRWIINFPTKKHWRNPSKMEWIRSGLVDLARVIRDLRIPSIAIPPLGCGNGGLDWPLVRSEIELALQDLHDVDIVVYEPTSTYQNTAKRSGIQALTPARALIAESVRRYAILGCECTNLEVQKLGWFLSRVIRKRKLADALSLRYTAHKYGPYADNLRHLLDGLDGSYLHCEKRLSDAGPTDLIWFEDSRRSAVTRFLESSQFQPYSEALEETTRVIDGFETPLGMELLSTVDWVASEMRFELELPRIKVGLDAWPGGEAASMRKRRLFDDRLLELAIQRLKVADL